VIFIFSTSEKIGARAIRWGLNSKVSHMAVLGDIKPKQLSITLESRMSDGVDITWLKTFQSKNKVVFALRPAVINDELSENLFKELSEKAGGTDYDWKGVSFLAASVIICLKVLGRALPKENKWADKDDDYCSEVMHILNGYLRSVGVDMEKYSKQMLTPDRALEILIDSGAFENVTDLFRGENG